jgi:tetratricopeptide (TPR) repeat protein
MKKKHFIFLTILIALGAFGYWYSIQQEAYLSTSEIILQADFSLDQEAALFWEDRIAGYQEILANEDLPESDRIGYLVAMAYDYESLGNYATAKEVMEEVIALAPDSQAVHTTYSRFLYAMQDYDAAVVYADIALEIDSAAAYLAWIWRGELEENVRRRGTAHEIYEAGLVATDYDEDLLLEYAEYLERIEDNVRAIEIWRELGERYPERTNTALARIEALGQ